MTSRDRVIRTLNHQPVDRAPRDLSLDARRRDALRRGAGRTKPSLSQRHCVDRGQIGRRASGTRRRRGGRDTTTPTPGVARGNLARTASPVLRAAPLAEADKIAAYVPPAELLEAGRFSAASRSCAGTTRFTLAQSDVQPLGRMQALRGLEGAMADLTSGKKETRRLLVRVHEHFRRELELWAGTNVDAVVIATSWGPRPRCGPRPSCGGKSSSRCGATTAGSSTTRTSSPSSTAKAT